jgi:hypothetical protein
MPHPWVGKASQPPLPPSRIACSPQTAKGSRRSVGAGPEPCSPRHICRCAREGPLKVTAEKKAVPSVVARVQPLLLVCCCRRARRIPKDLKATRDRSRFGFRDGVRLVCFSAVEVEVGTASYRGTCGTVHARPPGAASDGQPCGNSRLAPPGGSLTHTIRTGWCRFPRGHTTIQPNLAGRTDEAGCPHTTRCVRNSPGTGRTVLAHASEAPQPLLLRNPDEQQWLVLCKRTNSSFHCTDACCLLNRRVEGYRRVLSLVTLVWHPYNY